MVAWLESSAAGCRLGTLSGGTPRFVRYLRACSPGPNDLALVGTRAAWGGYQDVRCTEFVAEVFAENGAAAHLVQDVDGDCLGYRTSYRGLAADGKSFFYALLDTKPPAASSSCGNGGGCHWQLAGGRVMRISGARAAAVPGLPPAALIAGDAGRVAIVAPATAASSNGRTFDWPRAATNGDVQIRDSTSARLLASFRTDGVARAVALSQRLAAVLVQVGSGLRLEWYDAGSGRRLGSASVPRSTAQSVSTDGRFIVFSVGNSIRALDTAAGGKTTVRWRGSRPPVGLSVRAGRVVWGEDVGATARILSLGA